MKYKFIGTKQDLIDNGFELYDVEYTLYKDDDMFIENHYIYNLGHSRRGQFYFYTIDMRSEDRLINVYASKPDGTGSYVNLDINLIVDLIDKGLVVENDLTNKGERK